MVFELTSNDYFNVKFQGFWDNQALQVLRKIQAKGYQTVVYDKEHKCWRIKLEEYYDAFQMMQEFVTLINSEGLTQQRDEVEAAFCPEENQQQKQEVKVELHGIPTFAFDLT